MKQQPDIDRNHCLLISDSNESSQHFDSKQLSQYNLIKIAEDNLFNEYFEFLSRYMTKTQYERYVKELENKYDELSYAFAYLDKINWSGKFKVVDGQVIIIRKEQIPPSISPIDYVKQRWDIPSEYQIVDIQDCMLRGVSTDIDRHTTQLANKTKVELSNNTMPPHMHHESITKDSKLDCIDTNSTLKISQDDQSTVCDMFYDDSFSTGIKNNEFEGNRYKFTINESGTDTPSHNNMPVYDQFYVFYVRKL